MEILKSKWITAIGALARVGHAVRQNDQEGALAEVRAVERSMHEAKELLDLAEKPWRTWGAPASRIAGELLTMGTPDLEYFAKQHNYQGLLVEPPGRGWSVSHAFQYNGLTLVIWCRERVDPDRALLEQVQGAKAELLADIEAKQQRGLSEPYAWIDRVLINAELVRDGLTMGRADTPEISRSLLVEILASAKAAIEAIDLERAQPSAAEV